MLVGGHDNHLVLAGRLAGWLAGWRRRAGRPLPIRIMNPINQELYRNNPAYSGIPNQIDRSSLPNNTGSDDVPYF